MFSTVLVSSEALLVAGSAAESVAAVGGLASLVSELEALVVELDGEEVAMDEGLVAAVPVVEFVGVPSPEMVPVCVVAKVLGAGVVSLAIGVSCVVSVAESEEQETRQSSPAAADPSLVYVYFLSVCSCMAVMRFRTAIDQKICRGVPRLTASPGSARPGPTRCETRRPGARGGPPTRAHGSSEVRHPASERATLGWTSCP